MKIDEATTREKILKVTVRLLATGEPEKLTVRQIADSAGVNIAAVNYHFQTKENLVDEAIFAFSEKSFGMGVRILRDPEIGPAERLRLFFDGYAKGLVENPGATRTAFLTILRAQGSGGKYAGLTREMMEAVKENVGELSGGGDEDSAAQKTLMLFSAVIFPFLYLEPFTAACGVDYRDGEERGRYIAMLVRGLETKTR